MLLSDYGLNGVDKTTKVVLDDYLEFNHTQFIIQRGGSCVLVPFALRVILNKRDIRVSNISDMRANNKTSSNFKLR